MSRTGLPWGEQGWGSGGSAWGKKSLPRCPLGCGHGPVSLRAAEQGSPHGRHGLIQTTAAFLLPQMCPDPWGPRGCGGLLVHQTRKKVSGPGARGPFLCSKPGALACSALLQSLQLRRKGLGSPAPPCKPTVSSGTWLPVRGGGIILGGARLPDSQRTTTGQLIRACS